METRQQPFDSLGLAQGGAAPKDAAPAPRVAESAPPGVTVRVSVLDERQDEEEKEAGYGHGV